jgi:uncharacterized OB-fold protein
MSTSARYWREIPQRYRLEAARCNKCNEVAYPPRLVCSGCGGREFTTEALPFEGKVLTYSVIHVAPPGFEDQTPYALGIVELANGTRLTTQIVDADLDALSVGTPVRLEFRLIREEGEAGILCYGHKAVPA